MSYIAQALPERKPPIAQNESQQSPRRLKVTARLPNGSTITARGQEARCLLALHEAGARGVTALEVSAWALRLAAYTHYLGKKGLVINTVRENHLGGWHGRHVLASPIQIIEIEGGDFAPAVSHV